MPWYIGQSWLIIILSFLVGLLLGWALWRRPWHKRYHSESEAITRLTRDHTTTLSAKDAEISRLLDERGAAAAGATGTVAALTDTVTTEDAEDAEEAEEAATDSAEAAVETGAMDQQALTDTAAAAPVVESSESVDIADVDAPAVAVDEEHHALDVHEIDTPDVDVSDDATATAQISGLTSSTEGGTDGAGVADAAPAAEPDTAPADSMADSSDAGEGAAIAAAAAAATDGEDDDLERVEGIGPRIGAALRAAGITTFENLATSDVAKLQSALEAAGLRFAPSLPTWARQARLLADGDEEGFLKLTEQLVGGRDIGRRA